MAARGGLPKSAAAGMELSRRLASIATLSSLHRPSAHLSRNADILQYHLVLGDSLRARDIKEGETVLETALGKDITVVKKGKDVSIKLVRRGWREGGRGSR